MFVLVINPVVLVVKSRYSVTASLAIKPLLTTVCVPDLRQTHWGW